jgi:hypothetical protein
MSVHNRYGFLLITLSLNTLNICMQVRYGAFVDNQIIDCQFEHKEDLTDEEKNLLTLVFERGETTIDTAKKELALVTPAHPCIAACAKQSRITTQKEGKKDITWVGHLHFSNYIPDIPKTIETRLGLDSKNSNISDLMVSLFSRDMGSRFAANDCISKHGGNSQEEHMLLIKNTIVNHFRIDDNQVQTYLFKSNQHYDNYKYDFIDKTVLIDGSEANNCIKLYSVSPMHEEIFTDPMRFVECSVDFAKNIYGRIRMSPYVLGTVWQYNRLPLSNVPKYNVASLNATTLLKEDPYKAMFDPLAPLNRTIILGSKALKVSMCLAAGGAIGYAAGVAFSKIATRAPLLNMLKEG